MTNALTTAYAGSADSTPENIAAMLDVFLPDNLGMVYIPARVPRFQAGLKKVLSWLQGEVGEAGTIPADDLIEAMLQRNDPAVIKADEARTGPDDLVLVMLFDPEREDDVTLAQRAIEAGIRVVDLAAAGDDLALDDAVITFQEEEDAAQEAAGEAPPFEGGHPIGEPLPTPGQQVQRAQDAGLAAAAAHQVPAAGPGVILNIQLNIAPEHVATLAAAIVQAMGISAVSTMEATEVQAGTGLATVTPIHGVAGEEAPPNTKAYYYDSAKGTYRPARGKTRENETKVHLTVAEIKEISDNQLLA